MNVFPRPIQQSRFSGRMIYALSVVMITLIWSMPLFILVFTSLQSTVNINTGNYWAWPNWEGMFNYQIIFKKSPLALRVYNSFWISLWSVFGTVAFSTLAGYALEKYDFKIRRGLFLIFLIGNFIPFQILMIPVRELFLQYELFDTQWAVIIFNIAFQTGFGILFMKQYMQHVSNSLIEAGRLDGAGEWQIFWYIVLPASKKACASLSILIFIFVWGDVFWPLVLLQSDELKPLTLAFGDFIGEFSGSWNLVCAAATLACLPPLLLFIFTQKIFIQGLTLGVMQAKKNID